MKGMFSSPWYKHTNIIDNLSLFPRELYDENRQLIPGLDIPQSHIDKVNEYYTIDTPWRTEDYLAYALTYVNTNSVTFFPEFRYYYFNYKEVVFFANHLDSCFAKMVKGTWYLIDIYKILHPDTKHTDFWNLIINKDTELMKYIPGIARYANNLISSGEIASTISDWYNDDEYIVSINWKPEGNHLFFNRTECALMC